MSFKVRKFIAFLICFLFIFEQSGFAQVAGQLDISAHIAGLRNSFIQDKFRPLHLRYLSYDSLNNNFELLLDKGDFEKGLSPKGNVPEQSLKETTKTLLNYFFIGITLPNSSFWVNLRPDSENEIIDSELAKTDVGRILLEADLQLKKDTAKATSPETPEGKAYWDKLYQKAGELFGSENITIPTLTRPWIVPGEIIIRETPENAYIYKATLKVMLEQDYLKDSVVYNFKDERLKQLNEYSSQLIREKILPKLTKEINTAKRYSTLRQVYYSLILSQWFKQRFYGKGGLYSWLIDKKNLRGLTSTTPWSKSTYFKAYQTSFQQGEYNLKEPIYSLFGQTIRSYMSGGMNLAIEIPKQIPSGPGEIIQTSASPVTAIGASPTRLPTGKSVLGVSVKTNTNLNSPYSGIDIEVEPTQEVSSPLGKKESVASSAVKEEKETNKMASSILSQIRTLTQRIFPLIKNPHSDNDNIKKHSLNMGRQFLEKSSSLINVIIALTGIEDKSRWQAVLEDIIEYQFENEYRPVVEPITNGLDAISSGDYPKEVNIAVKKDNITIIDKAGGMDLGEIMTYLIVPKISGSRGGEGAIAQFGVGFYSLLKFLKGPSDQLIVRTFVSEKEDGYEIAYEFKNGMGIDNLYLTIHSIKNIEKRRGTEILIKGSFNPQGVLKEIKDALSYNGRADIYVDYNGQRLFINDLSSFETISTESGQVLVQRVGLDEQSEVILTIMGVKIFSIPLTGKNIPQKLVVELSKPSLVPRARNQVEINARARTIIKEFIEELLVKEDWQALNGFISLLSQLDEENKSKEDKLADYFYRRLFELTRERDIIFLPDIDKLQKVGDGAILLNPQSFLKLISLGYRPNLKQYGFYTSAKKSTFPDEPRIRDIRIRYIADYLNNLEGNRFKWSPEVNANIYAIEIEDNNVGLLLVSNDEENGPIFLLNKKYLPQTRMGGIILETLIEFILGERGDYEGWDYNVQWFYSNNQSWDIVQLPSSAYLRALTKKYDDAFEKFLHSGSNLKIEVALEDYPIYRNKTVPIGFSLSSLPLIISLIKKQSHSVDIASLKKALEGIDKGEISLNPLGIEYTQRALQTAVDQQNITPYINIRENVQNSRDEAIRQSRKGNLAIKAETSKDRKIIILTFEDDFGMDTAKLLEFLLNPEVSDKRQDERLTGMFGQGFFTNLKDAKEVSIKTSLGNGVVNYVTLQPIRNKKQETIDIKVRIIQKTSDYKGTEIRVIKNANEDSADEISHILEKAALYVGLINKDVLEITFNGDSLNQGGFTQKDLLSQAETPYGKLSFYHRLNRRAITHKQLYVTSINERYVKAIPPLLLEILLKQGIVIDLPDKLELISDRSGLTLSDEQLTQIERATFVAAIMAAAKLYVDGLKEIVELFPYDFESPKELLFRAVPEDVLKDSQYIQEGRLEDLDINKYTRDREKLVYLISTIPIYQGLSVRELLIKIARGEISIESIPLSLRGELLREREKLMSKIRGDSNGRIRQVEEENIAELKPFSPDILKNYPQFSIYSSLAEFLSKTASILLGKEIKVMLTADLKKGALAYTWRGSDTIVWNLVGMNRRIEQLSHLLQGKLQMDEPEAKDLIGGLVLGIAHEATHIPEATQNLTHNLDFKMRIIELLQKMVLKDNSQKIIEIIETLKSQNHQAPFISTGLFTSIMADKIQPSISLNYVPLLPRDAMPSISSTKEHTVDSLIFQQEDKPASSAVQPPSASSPLGEQEKSDKSSASSSVGNTEKSKIMSAVFDKLGGKDKDYTLVSESDTDRIRIYKGNAQIMVAVTSKDGSIEIYVSGDEYIEVIKTSIPQGVNYEVSKCPSPFTSIVKIPQTIETPFEVSTNRLQVVPDKIRSLLQEAVIGNNPIFPIDELKLKPELYTAFDKMMKGQLVTFQELNLLKDLARRAEDNRSKINQAWELIAETNIGKDITVALKRINPRQFVYSEPRPIRTFVEENVILIPQEKFNLSLEMFATLLIHEMDHLYRYYVEKVNPKSIHGEYLALKTQAAFLREMADRLPYPPEAYHAVKTIDLGEEKAKASLRSEPEYRHYPEYTDFTEDDIRNVEEKLTSSPLAEQSSPLDKKGGVDFRALPAVRQPMNMPTIQGQSPKNNHSLDLSGTVPVNINLDEEWRQMENMIQAGIIPSSQRIKEYLQACCQNGNFSEELDKVLSGIADILRLEEEKVFFTEPALKELLVLLESDKSAQELQVALGKITVLPKEPKRINAP